MTELEGKLLGSRETLDRRALNLRGYLEWNSTRSVNMWESIIRTHRYGDAVDSHRRYESAKQLMLLIIFVGDKKRNCEPERLLFVSRRSIQMPR